MSTIGELLAQRAQLAAVSDSAALDAELLLCHCLDCSRTYLYTWPEREVPEAAAQQFQQLLARRTRGEPIAHLTGIREFWSLPLAVNASTLIPRPDTETLVEIALAQIAVEEARALDLGSGTGAIALALASERPRWSVLGVDRSPDAVALARRNADNLGLQRVQFLCSDWFAQIAPGRFDLIVSNPPYIDARDPHLALGDVRFEPRSALVADRDGLGAIIDITSNAGARLNPGGWLLFEHGWDQAGAVRALLARHGFDNVDTWRDAGGRERISGGRKP